MSDQAAGSTLVGQRTHGALDAPLPSKLVFRRMASLSSSFCCTEGVAEAEDRNDAPRVTWYQRACRQHDPLGKTIMTVPRAGVKMTD